MNVFERSRRLKGWINCFLRRRSPGKTFSLVGILLTLWTSGCAHNRQPQSWVRAEVLLPKLTALSTGPVAVLLTNGSAFRAEFTLTSEVATNPPEKISGQLFVRGTQLRWETRFDHSNGKSKPAGNFEVIWDATSNRGYAVSEALQGYATINPPVHSTNRATQVMAGPAERFQGQLVDKVSASVIGSNGQITHLELLRTQAPGNVPLQVRFSDGPQSVTLTLSEIQQTKLSEDLFLPPASFTKYANETALINELADREQSFSGGGRGPVGPEHRPGSPDRGQDDFH
jgi:hypothetical protein